MKDKIDLNPNPLVRYLKKPSNEFTKADIMRFIENNGIRMLNFRYVGGDGRLKTLNFVINSRHHLDRLLSAGERVDGSSLFSFISAASSDLYVIPRYRTAFVEPFSEIPTLDLLCSYYTADGNPLESSPENLVKKAHRLLNKKTGCTLEMFGELEYYLFSEIDSIYPIVQQRGYHESRPFSKRDAVRREAMRVVSEMGCPVKYGHAEVGNIIHGGVEMVQHEIEFLPAEAEDAADQMVLAKWAVREVACKFGYEVSYAPKIIVGHAGNGLHIHVRLMENGFNVMADDQGLTPAARKLISGLLTFAPSLTAFGNTVPTSFLRLVPRQEAPTRICWGECNRSVLVRVPLGWCGATNMIYDANPQEPRHADRVQNSQTVELRSPDGSANVHTLLAGMTLAVLYGLEDPNALEKADRLFANTADVGSRTDLDNLPTSCYEAALELEKARSLYEQSGVFPKGFIDQTIADLKAHNDADLSENLPGNVKAISDLVKKFMHCG